MAGPDFSRGTENLGFFCDLRIFKYGSFIPHVFRDYVASKRVINLWPQEESRVTNRFPDYYCPQPSQQPCQAGTTMTVQEGDNCTKPSQGHKAPESLGQDPTQVSDTEQKAFHWIFNDF